MKVKVCSLPDVRTSKKGKVYAVFSVQDTRGRVFRVLAFDSLATQLDPINRQGADIIVDGEVSTDRNGDDVIYLSGFKTEQGSPENRSGGAPARPIVVSAYPEYELREDEERRTWARFKR